MSASYPASLKTFTTKANLIDIYDASHINDLQDEVSAIEAELGSDVAGSSTDLKTRLARCLADNGAMKQGTSFPGSPNEGDFFYRTDLDNVYVYDGSSWDAQSGLTNYTVGNYKILPNPTKLVASNYTTYTKIAEIYLPRAGDLRVKFWIAASGGATTYGRIYRNGVAVGTEQTTSSAVGTQFSEDITGWASGDLLQLYTKISTGAQEHSSGALEIFEGSPSKEEVDDVTYRVSKQYTFSPGSLATISALSGLGSIGDTLLSPGGGASTTLYVKTAAGTWTAK